MRDRARRIMFFSSPIFICLHQYKTQDCELGDGPHSVLLLVSLPCMSHCVWKTQYGVGMVSIMCQTPSQDDELIICRTCPVVSCFLEEMPPRQGYFCKILCVALIYRQGGL